MGASTFLILFSILSQLIWYNKNIETNNKPIYDEELAKQNIIFLCFDAKNGCKTWDEMKTSYNRNDTSLFKRGQIVNSFPKT